MEGLEEETTMGMMGAVAGAREWQCYYESL
jgi:hypothetical protein